MKNLVNRAQVALNGEGGGPSVEQVLGIAFALIIATAIFAFGGQLIDWISGAGKKVTTWASGDGEYKQHAYKTGT